MKEVSSQLSGILVAAHELKAPLATMRQLALSLDNLSAENSWARDEIVNISERAMRQVADLTKIRRLEAGEFEMGPVAVRGVCDEVTRELEYLFRAENRGLAVHYTNRSRVVTANRELLYSVIYNFVLNAMHYARAETLTELSVRDSGERVKISVRDYGPALPLDIWKEMQSGGLDAPTSVAMRPGSSGLGLFIASKFSRYMKGNVGAVRHRDGTSFYVELPTLKQSRLRGIA